MKTLSRFLLWIALALWLALPGIGSDGGDNAGGTGVWILPRSTFLASAAADVGGCAERSKIPVPVSPTTIELTTSSELGSFSATFVDEVSGVAVALPANSRNIVLSADLLRDVRDSGVPGQVIVLDGLQQGYVIKITFAPSGAGEIKVY